MMTIIFDFFQDLIKMILDWQIGWRLAPLRLDSGQSWSSGNSPGEVIDRRDFFAGQDKGLFLVRRKKVGPAPVSVKNFVPQTFRPKPKRILPRIVKTGP